MKISYGITGNSIDVTSLCIKNLQKNGIITIPYGDINRANHFTDPLVGVHKKIFIENNGVIVEYDEYVEVIINTLNNTINIFKNKRNILNKNNKIDDIHSKLNDIHSKLKINYGNFKEELPEQKMVVRYLTGNEKVLELGGNIGRNSLVIASILKNDNNFVTLESDVKIAKQLTENRDLNNFHFHIENSALSKKKLIQRGWNTIPSDTLLQGYNFINTITLDNLKNKYKIDFDTLVLDCEGAFYYILMDMPEILNNIKLIIMENDYDDISKKMYIDKILIKNNYVTDYTLSGGWGPCYKNFFEVWKKV